MRGLGRSTDRQVLSRLHLVSCHLLTRRLLSLFYYWWDWLLSRTLVIIVFAEINVIGSPCKDILNLL